MSENPLGNIASPGQVSLTSHIRVRLAEEAQNLASPMAQASSLLLLEL